MKPKLMPYQERLVAHATGKDAPNTFWVPYGLGKSHAPKPVGRLRLVSNIPGRSLRGADEAAREDIHVICKMMGVVPMDFETFGEWLSDMTPVAGACSARGGHMHYPENPTKKRRSTHLAWVSKVSGVRIRDIKKLLRGERIS